MLFHKSTDFDFHINVLTKTHLNHESEWIGLPGWSEFHNIRITEEGSVIILLDSRLNFIKKIKN